MSIEKEFKDGVIPDFGENELHFKNGKIKINDLKEIDKFNYVMKDTEEQKKKFLKEKAKQMTAITATNDFMYYCKKYKLTLEEMELVLQHLEHEHQSLVKKSFK